MLRGRTALRNIKSFRGAEMHFSCTRTTVALLLASTAVLAMPAFAQETPPASDQKATADTDYSNDIVVTAQKRSENLQDVPIAIQAFGTQKLDDLNITDFKEYSTLLPQVTFSPSQGEGAPGKNVVNMRGVTSGGDGNHSGSLPTVGVYLDEQPVSTIGGNLDVHIYDIARIEALSGPQGTLYGASSEAGTLRIITNKPDTSGFYGRMDAEVNSVDHGGVGGKIEGMLNMPLSSSAALRVVGFYERDAGYIDNVEGTRTFVTPVLDGAGNPVTDPSGAIETKPGITVNNAALVKKNYNDTETWGGRAALKVDLDSNWTVTPSVIYQENRTHGMYAYDPSVGDLQVQHFYPEYGRDRFIQAALTIEGKLGNWDITYAGAYLDNKDLSVTDYTDYAEAYDAYYASAGLGGIAGYQHFVDSSGNTIDPRQTVIGTDHFKKLSQEFRVASPSTDRFRVVAGAFYQHQSNLIHQDYEVPGLAPDVSVTGHPGTLWLTQQYRVDRDYAMFGEASYDILPNLTLTAGGRAFIYDNSLIGFFGFGAGNPGGSDTGENRCIATDGLPITGYGNVPASATGVPLPPAVAGGPCTDLARYVNGVGLEPIEASGQGFTHRLNLTWKATPDVMLYATWSRGFRPGGINRRSDVAAYEPDYLTNYEIGWKTTFLGGRAHFNGAIYQENWKNFQFSYLGPNSLTIVVNGPDARIRGAEMDANYNDGHLALTASGAYNTSKTLENLCQTPDPTFTCASSEITAPAGTPLPITPKLKFNVTGRYTVPLGGAKAYAQVVLAHQSSAASDIRLAEAALLGRLKPYNTADLSLGATWATFSLEVFAQNIWDERAQLGRFVECGSCTRSYIITNTPRTIGLRGGFKF
jgi:outer membrane receptor protein involved in Fe transport